MNPSPPYETHPVFCRLPVCMGGVPAASSGLPRRRGEFFCRCPVRPRLDLWMQYRYFLQWWCCLRQSHQLSADYLTRRLCPGPFLRHCRLECFQRLVHLLCNRPYCFNFLLPKYFPGARYPGFFRRSILRLAYANRLRIVGRTEQRCTTAVERTELRSTLLLPDLWFCEPSITTNRFVLLLRLKRPERFYDTARKHQQV